MKKNSALVKNKIYKFNKVIKIPPDKSTSLRALILASQCIGISRIKNFEYSNKSPLYDLARFSNFQPSPNLKTEPNHSTLKK